MILFELQKVSSEMFYSIIVLWAFLPMLIMLAGIVALCMYVSPLFVSMIPYVIFLGCIVAMDELVRIEILRKN
jgi:hypothetical protein